MRDRPAGRRRHGPRALVAAALLGGALAADARAEGPRGAIDLDRCVAVDRDEVERLLAIELDARPALRPVGDAEAPRLVASCEGRAVLLRASGPASGPSVARPVRLEEALPSARPRLLALAAAELLAAYWEEAAGARPAATPAPPQPPTPRPPVAAVVTSTAPPVPPARLRLLATLGAQRASAGFGLETRAGARVARELGRHLGVALDAQAAAAGADASAGRVSFQAVSLTGIGAWRWDLGTWSVWVGVGPRVGRARLRGAPDDARAVAPASFSAWLSAVVAAVSTTYEAPGGFVVEARAEAGQTLTPLGAKIERRRELAYEGPWLGLGLALGWRL